MQSEQKRHTIFRGTTERIVANFSKQNMRARRQQNDSSKGQEKINWPTQNSLSTKITSLNYKWKRHTQTTEAEMIHHYKSIL